MPCFAFGKQNAKNQYFINGQIIDAAQSVTDLGIEVDFALKYDLHINSIVSKAYSRIGVLFKGFASRNIQILK